jgi:hypothetical protein
VIDAAYDRVAIVDAVQRQLRHARYPAAYLYGEGRAGERTAGVLAEAPLRI